MNFGPVQMRAWHRWLALLSALPLFVVFTTGVLLSISPKIETLQPRAPRSSARMPGISLSFEQILASARSVPEARIVGWEDVSQVDARPGSGLVRVRAENYWEIQIDGHTGEVVRSAPRWKTLLIEIHEGSWFASWAQFWIFLPAGVAAVLLWLTGVIIWVRRFRTTRTV